VRHYFGQYEEGEERPVVAEKPAEEAGEAVRELSIEAIAEAEEAESASDAISEADAREEEIESENDAVDTLVDESQDVSDEGVETNGNDRG